MAAENAAAATAYEGPKDQGQVKNRFALGLRSVGGLKDLLREKGLKLTGNKSELVEVLHF